MIKIEVDKENRLLKLRKIYKISLMMPLKRSFRAKMGLLSLIPIVQLKAFHTAKMLLVVRYQDQVVGQREGGNDKIKIIKWCSLGPVELVGSFDS